MASGLQFLFKLKYTTLLATDHSQRDVLKARLCLAYSGVYGKAKRTDLLNVQGLFPLYSKVGIDGGKVQFFWHTYI